MEITSMQNRTDSFFLNGEYLTKYQENYRIVYLLFVLNIKYYT